jgi:transposase InsO family protein
VLQPPVEPREYAAADYTAVCARLGVVRSMGRVASALNNAAAEAVNSILKTEYVYRNSFATREQTRLAVGRWIDRFYNTRRRHSWCGGISPLQYEHQHKINTAGQPAAA